MSQVTILKSTCFLSNRLNPPEGIPVALTSIICDAILTPLATVKLPSRQDSQCSQQRSSDYIRVDPFIGNHHYKLSITAYHSSIHNISIHHWSGSPHNICWNGAILGHSSNMLPVYIYSRSLPFYNHLHDILSNMSHQLMVSDLKSMASWLYSTW